MTSGLNAQKHVEPVRKEESELVIIMKKRTQTHFVLVIRKKLSIVTLIRARDGQDGAIGPVVVIPVTQDLIHVQEVVLKIKNMFQMKSVQVSQLKNNGVICTTVQVGQIGLIGPNGLSLVAE